MPLKPELGGFGEWKRRYDMMATRVMWMTDACDQLGRSTRTVGVSLMGTTRRHTESIVTGCSRRTSTSRTRRTLRDVQRCTAIFHHQRTAVTSPTACVFATVLIDSPNGHARHAPTGTRTRASSLALIHPLCSSSRVNERRILTPSFKLVACHLENGRGLDRHPFHRD